jgi:hypothetical protein
MNLNLSIIKTNKLLLALVPANTQPRVPGFKEYKLVPAICLPLNNLGNNLKGKLGLGPGLRGPAFPKSPRRTIMTDKGSKSQIMPKDPGVGDKIERN